MGAYCNQGHSGAVAEQSQCMDDFPKPGGKGKLGTKENRLIQRMTGEHTEAEPGPRWYSGKESASNAGDVGDVGSIPVSGRSPGRGNGTPLQDSCLENPMDRGAWWATVHGVTKSQTRLND